MGLRSGLGSSRRRAMLAVTTLCGAGMSLGCSESPANPSPVADGGGSPGRTALCAEAFLPNGFGLGWERLNHRISSYVVSFDATAATGCQVEPGATVRAQFIGGDFTTGATASDEPIVRASYAVVGAHELGQHPLPAVQTAFGSVALDLDPSQAATGDIPALELGPEVSASVLAVVGLSLQTDVPQGPDYPADYDPAHGYTVNGLAVSFAEGSPAQATVRFGLGLADRAQMNAAIPYASTRAVAHVMRVGVQDGVVTPGSIHISHQYPAAEPFDTTPLPPLPAGKTSLTIEGQPGYERAAVLLTSLDLQLFQSDPDHGYYLRELGVRLREPRYDVPSGAMAVNVGLYVSNSGMLTEGAMELEADISVALIQWNGKEPVAQLEFEQTFEVGDEPASFPLPLEPPR